MQKAMLNPALDAAIANLPVNSTDPMPYIDFFNHRDTHFAHKLQMGGRYGVRSSFSASEFAKMSFSSIDIKVSAGYSGLTSINVNAATSGQQEKAGQFESYRKDFQIYQIGGKPPLNENKTSNEWAQTVTQNPLPLAYDLVAITNIFTPENFPDDPHIQDKRRNLEDSVISYCKDLELPNKTLCHTGETTSDLIKVHFINTLQNSTCAKSSWGKTFQ